MVELNGSLYGITGLTFKIKQGVEWRETFLVEGDLSNGTLSGYVAKQLINKVSEDCDRYADFVFENTSYGDFDVDSDDPLIGFTQFDAVLPVTQTEEIPATPIKQPLSPQAGKHFWQADIIFTNNSGIPISIIRSATVFVEGGC